MRKTKLLTIFGIVCIGFGAFISCNLSTNSGSEVNGVKSENDRRLELTELFLSDDYKVSTEEVFEDLNDFLLSKDGLNTDLKTKGSVQNNDYRFKKIKDTNIDLSSYGKNSIMSKSIDETAKDNINFSIVDISSSDGQKGYALVSDDRRIGTVLMYTDDSPFNEDISEDSFMQFVVSSLNDYIQKTKDIWDDIDETDYERLKEKYGITDEQIEQALKEHEAGIQPKKMFGTSYSKWSNALIKGPMLNTQWEQSDFNSLVSEIKEEEDGVPVGCGPLAVAQIMAYYRYPTKTQYSESKVRSLSKKYSSASGWDGTYNWDNILLKNKNGIRDASCLLYEIGKRAWTQYTPNKSGTWGPFLIAAIETMGYSSSGGNSFSFGKIRSSIDAGCPVLVEGYTSSRYIGLPFWKWIEWGDGEGHAFVCDGYLYQERTKTTYVFWIPISDTEKNEYVHFNPGWGESAIGWYKSGIFDMQGGYTDDTGSIMKKGTSSNSNDYSKAVRIWTNIKPK